MKETFFERKIKPLAESMDDSPRKLRRGFKLLGKQSWLAQRIPKNFGGLEANARDYFEYTELVQSYSGALGFFQRQHQAAGRFLCQSENAALKEATLCQLPRGKWSCGVSLSHLRMPHAPCILASRRLGGWNLSGQVSWVSGYKLFDSLVVGFFCPSEGLEGMGLLRFKKSRSLHFSKPLKTVAMRSIQTVSMRLKDFFLEEKDLLSLMPIGHFAETYSALNIQFVNLSALARAFLRGVEAPRLEQDYLRCRQTFLKEGCDATLYGEMARIATLLSLVEKYHSGIQSVIAPNPVERRARELLLFSLILPEKRLLDQSLKRIVGIE